MNNPNFEDEFLNSIDFYINTKRHDSFIEKQNLDFNLISGIEYIAGLKEKIQREITEKEQQFVSVKTEVDNFDLTNFNNYKKDLERFSFYQNLAHPRLKQSFDLYQQDRQKLEELTNFLNVLSETLMKIKSKADGDLEILTRKSNFYKDLMDFDVELLKARVWEDNKPEPPQPKPKRTYTRKRKIIE